MSIAPHPRATPATTVLVVEDEPLLRAVAADIAEDEGYCVIEAETADEALAIIASRGGVDILFTDVRMPGSLDGLRLAEIVRGRWPAIGLVVTSGHFRPEPANAPEAPLFVPKPYRGYELARALRAVGRRARA